MEADTAFEFSKCYLIDFHFRIETVAQQYIVKLCMYTNYLATFFVISGPFFFQCRNVFVSYGRQMEEVAADCEGERECGRSGHVTMIPDQIAERWRMREISVS